MSTLSSTSTFAEVIASYKDNASYAEDNSVAKANAFVTACRFLILILKEEAQAGAERVRQGMNAQMIQAEMTTAQQYVTQNATPANGGSGVRHLKFGSFGR